MSNVDSRGKPGENRRPRPGDRQLIQERVKELREFVPNGTEMLCDDRGVLLEIAQVIRSLDLTILKGVMESRSNDTWAHFIVEACKGFHRLGIFWPLMQLLRRRRNSISTKDLMHPSSS
ncbi:hypothetical protein H0E87_026725 [Populus deltoides]|uniref:BHLH domain-containing protein n=1 Tax=Populus deltoides TaxID=3696 RepID=A0A8T2WZ93_POPDE|nr:hypothetical protein H0E87_026725 [Populus deltoides]